MVRVALDRLTLIKSNTLSNIPPSVGISLMRLWSMPCPVRRKMTSPAEAMTRWQFEVAHLAGDVEFEWLGQGLELARDFE